MKFTEVLGWTLLHFLWEGAGIAVLLAGALALLRNAKANVRYAASCGAMLLMLVSAVGTFLLLAFRANEPRVAAAAGLAEPLRWITLAGGTSVSTLPATTDYLAVAVWAWFGGVIALTIRSLGGWAVAGRLARRHTWPAGAVWEQKFAALTARLSISRPVKLAVSAIVQVPSVVGWIRPIVLVPAAVFAGLPAEQIEALLAHELAHVRRFDYLFNLLQTAGETLLFYHPAMWWVSGKIRMERENCCDDLAVEICGNTVTYVHALTELEQMRQHKPSLAMAATGGSLLGRIQRLLRMNQAAPVMPAGWVASLGILLAVCAAVIGRNAPAQQPRRGALAAPAVTSVHVQLAQADAQKGGPKANPQQAATQNTAAQNTPSSQENPRGAGVGGGVGAGVGGVEKNSGSWLEQIQSEGYRDLTVDQLIALKIHGVSGEYIRQMRAAGFQLTADQLVSFRIHGVTSEFVSQLHQAGFQNLKPDDVISLRIHGADPAWIRQIQSLGFSDLSIDKIVQLRIHGITPEFIQEARKHFPNISLDQLIQLKQFGIL
ncbi:MAG TPA: M56 family metallopeptidase [Bryobacteraceae bacterium]